MAAIPECKLSTYLAGKPATTLYWVYLGSKGVGELGTIGATPAVVNAVVDALDHAGQGAAAEQVQMPLTAEAVWRALNGSYPAKVMPG